MPRRVLKATRIVLVEHMDDVLREALCLPMPDALFGPPRERWEYRDGELVVVPAGSRRGSGRGGGRGRMVVRTGRPESRRRRCPRERSSLDRRGGWYLTEGGPCVKWPARSHSASRPRRYGGEGRVAQR